ncbi:hypothetical protein CMO90_01760 [Candidatus Woesearchaeota archaeon]|nr:hypothetical protein [Candidatus Woesearchaeota archaeon]|tara:strand:+ start:655 stop:1137 length:483 start_codon:yes stop_codon:yes gene_type:complete
MRELFDDIPRITLSDKADFLIDTCFFVYVFDHYKEPEFNKFLEKHVVAITSFNIEELIHIFNKLKGHTKSRIRKFFHKKNKLSILNLPIHPGNADKEHSFVKNILPAIDKEEHDPSDAVILAAAIKVSADVLTRDKHDLFNTRMENFLRPYGVRILNKIV